MDPSTGMAWHGHGYSNRVAEQQRHGKVRCGHRWPCVRCLVRVRTAGPLRCASCHQESCVLLEKQETTLPYLPCYGTVPYVVCSALCGPRACPRPRLRPPARSVLQAPVVRPRQLCPWGPAVSLPPSPSPHSRAHLLRSRSSPFPDRQCASRARVCALPAKLPPVRSRFVSSGSHSLAL